jgi:uncharacterized protein
MNAPARTGALAGLLLAAGALPAAALADVPSPGAERAFEATTLSLDAHGQVEVAPDRASITLGVQTHAPTAAEAMARNAGQMNAVLTALRKAGVAERNVRTSTLSLSADYAYPQNKPPELTGYAAGDDVTVIVDDLARLGPVIDAVTAAGANQINGVSFGLKDPAAAEDAARLAAVKALSAKAALYAEATGYHLARLVNLSEAGGYAPPQPVRAVMYMAKAAAPTPIAAGELTVRIDVTGLYELAK